MKYQDIDFSIFPENPTEREWLGIERKLFEAYEPHAKMFVWDKERMQINDELKMDILHHMLNVFRKRYTKFVSGEYSKAYLIRTLKNKAFDILKRPNPYKIFSFDENKITQYQDEPVENELILVEKEKQHQNALLKLNNLIQSKPYCLRIYSEYHKYNGDKTFIEMARGNRLAEDVLKKEHKRFLLLFKRQEFMEDILDCCLIIDPEWFQEEEIILPKMYILKEKEQKDERCKNSNSPFAKTYALFRSFYMKIFKRC